MNERWAHHLPEGQSVLSNEEIYERISENPWDKEVTTILRERLLAEHRHPMKFRSECYHDRAQREPLLSVVDRLRSAVTLEEKYEVLAEEVPYEPGFVRHYRNEYNVSPPPISWMDFIQSRAYEVNPSLDPEYDAFNSPRPSVYDALAATVEGDRWRQAVDLGSGTGRTTDILSNCAQRVVAVDAFGFLHRVARRKRNQRGETKVDYLVADATEPFPIAQNSADLVLSNGLTAFVPKERMNQFITETARLLEEGGSYVECGISGELNQAIKDDFCSSPSGLLAYLAGELVVSPGEGEAWSYPHSVSELHGVFSENGFHLILHQHPKGAIVFEYVNRLPNELDQTWKSYQEGDYAQAASLMRDVLAGEDQIERNLRISGKMAQFSEGPRSLTGFAEVFVFPLAEIVLRNGQTEEVDDQVKDILSQNIWIVREIVRATSRRSPGDQETLQRLIDLGERLNENPKYQHSHLASILKRLDYE